ncbi:DEAD/DEAH box helicase [Myxococcota bacterium]|nr:DEAD/DEAH box helicase [Myxococcota bacterium]
MPDPGPGPEQTCLNPLQEAAAEAGFFSTEHHFLLNFPTGAGKTWMVTQLAARAVAAGRSCVISVPLRALASELYEQLLAALPCGTVALCTGAARRGRPWRTGALTIATHEAFFLQVRLSGLSYLSTLAFAAIDEIHMLEQPGRGALLETLLVRLFRLAPFARVITLSATLAGGDPRLCAWLGAACVRGSYRPVPLSLATVPYEAGRREEKLLELVTGDARTTLVFVHSRRRAARLVERLAGLGVPSAVHHAGLTVKRQAQVLRRLQDGAVRVVVATPTLEMGLNLPVDRVICPELVFPGAGPRRWERISARVLHQRLGRAGRPGLGVAGEGLVLVRAGTADPLSEPFAPVRSQLAADLDAFVLHELGDKLSASLPQLERALALTFAAHCGEPLLLEDALERLAALELVQWPPRETPVHSGAGSRRAARGKAPRIELTPLGVAAASQFGAVTRFAGACGLLQRELTAFDVLWIAHACVVPEAYFPLDELARLGDDLADTPSFLMSAPESFEGRLDVSRREAVVAACAVAALLAWREVPKKEREDRMFWGASWEAVRLRAWHAQRVLLAMGRLLKAAPGFPVHASSVEALGSASEILRLRHPQLDLRELAPSAPRWRSGPLVRGDLGELDEPRLRRALQCQVEPCDDGACLVTHRGAPHRVSGGTCDCPDFSSGRPCKHVLAVRLLDVPPVAGPGESPGTSFEPVRWWIA